MNQESPQPAGDFNAADKNAWRKIIEAYRQASMPRAVWQLINTLVPYAAVWTLMYFCVSVSWWLAIPLVMLAGGLLVRIRSEEHTSELQSLMRISYAVFCLTK